MTKLAKLSHAEHGALKIIKNCTVSVAENQHVIALRVNEVGQAATSFPIFINRLADTDNWALSAMASLEPNSNLFVKNDFWQANHVPINMQTYPLFLMADEAEKGYAIGIVPEDKAFTKDDEGFAMFNDDGEHTDMVKGMVKVLEDDIKGSAQTQNFLKTLEKLDLLKPSDLLVNYSGGRVNRLQGLHTIDEEKLREISDEAYLELRNNGYIIAIHAIMLSAYQLKALINRHNQDPKLATVEQVQMDLNVKDETKQEAGKEIKDNAKDGAKKKTKKGKNDKASACRH